MTDTRTITDDSNEREAHARQHRTENLIGAPANYRAGCPICDEDIGESPISTLNLRIDRSRAGDGIATNPQEAD